MRSRLQHIIAAATLALASGPGFAAGGQLYVVVNTNNPIQKLATRDAVALYTGRTRVFPDGREAVAYDQAEASVARADFYRSLTGMDLARINSYWARLRFSGQVQPPRMLNDDGQVAATVRADPNAVGYLRNAPTDPALKVVLVMPASADGGSP